MAAGTVTGAQIIDISRILQHPPRKFVANLIIWTFCVMLFDGFDIAAITYTAPDMMKQWQISPKMFGVIFSAAIFGIMIGSFVFGYIGDKIGRKKTLFISTAWFSLFTLATVFAFSYESLLLLRFIAGVGLGGAVPQAIVLVSEYAPKGSGVKWVTVMFTGFSIGATLGGILAAWLLPLFGWKSMFIVGGVIPLVVSVISYYLLPESIRFLSLQKGRRAELIKIIGQLQPGLRIEPNAEFTMLDEKKDKKQPGMFSLRMLFSGILGIATPIIWLFYIINSLAVFFLKSWFPVLFVAAGFTAAQASLTTAWFSFGGLIGGLLVGWVMDKYGMRAGTAFPLLGTLVTGILGYVSGMTLTVLVFFVGFFVVGTQYILTACTPLFYPTAIRTNADGIAIGIAKIGSIAGPVAGGILIGMNMPVGQLFVLVALPVAVSAVLCFILTTIYQRYYTENL